jgi:hypothetical protein
MELVIGDYYKIKCGWGNTKAKLTSYGVAVSPVGKETGKTIYRWEDKKGFKFCSYDLEDTVKL